jgi:DNA-binding NarL/FixJ family response regulator
LQGVRQTIAAAPTAAPRVHVNLVSLDPCRRSMLFDRLDGDARFTLAHRAQRPDAAREVLVLDIAGAERHGVEFVRRVARGPAGPHVLAIVDDEDDLELGHALVLAGAAGVASLRQPSSCLCQAVVDIADGLASVSPALEVALVRELQALPAD